MKQHSPHSSIHNISQMSFWEETLTAGVDEGQITLSTEKLKIKKMRHLVPSS